MILEYRIRVGDTLPKLRHQLKLNGAVIDVTTATVALERVRRIDGVVVGVVGTITKIDAVNGIVEFAPTSADTTPEAVYDLRWNLQWVDGELTLPTDCPVRMLVLA